ncbi:MAG: hypothetical protein HXM16_07890 [Fusobacterium periodonticum]|nr:hypothetical protein [Fusobacterium periodonticum]
MEHGSIINNNSKEVYCHFSFKRPKGKNYGLFAVAFYLDFEGKVLTAQATRRFPLWKDHQFVTAIQAYEHALYSIYVWQGIMRSKGISHVWLLTDNSTLAGWIENPKKNKAYTEYMNRAVEQYRVGAPKEITLSIGLCEVRDYEKSYKFCREDKVINDGQTVIKETNTGRKVIDLDSSNLQYQTISQLEASNPNKPEIIGM